MGKLLFGGSNQQPTWGSMLQTPAAAVAVLVASVLSVSVNGQCLGTIVPFYVNPGDPMWATLVQVCDDSMIYHVGGSALSRTGGRRACGVGWPVSGFCT